MQEDHSWFHFVSAIVFQMEHAGTILNTHLGWSVYEYSTINVLTNQDPLTSLLNSSFLFDWRDAEGSRSPFVCVASNYRSISVMQECSIGADYNDSALSESLSEVRHVRLPVLRKRSLAPTELWQGGRGCAQEGKLFLAFTDIMSKIGVDFLDLIYLKSEREESQAVKTEFIDLSGH